MDKRQEAKLNMYHAVINHCDANAAFIATLPALVTLIAAFKIKVAAITATGQKEIQVISGITADKKAKRKTLYNMAANIAAVVYSYAVSQKNFVLREGVNFSKTKLRYLKDDELAPTCLNILNAVNTHSLALAAYGITATTISGFNDTINNYTAVKAAPRNATALRTTYSGTLQTLFKECSNMLNEQLDKLALQFKTTNPEFYIAYKNNRIIIDPASHKNPAPTLP